MQRLLLCLGVAWGCVYVILGFMASFTLGHNDTVLSIALLFLLFFSPIPTSILAFWRPLWAALVLIFALIVNILILAITTGRAGTVTALKSGYFVAHIVFASIYFYLGILHKHRAVADIS